LRQVHFELGLCIVTGSNIVQNFCDRSKPVDWDFFVLYEWYGGLVVSCLHCCGKLPHQSLCLLNVTTRVLKIEWLNHTSQKHQGKWNQRHQENLRKAKAQCRVRGQAEARGKHYTCPNKDPLPLEDRCPHGVQAFLWKEPVIAAFFANCVKPSSCNCKSDNTKRNKMPRKEAIARQSESNDRHCNELHDDAPGILQRHLRFIHQQESHALGIFCLRSLSLSGHVRVLCLCSL